MRCILTAQAAALPIALREAGDAQVLRLLEPGVALCEGVGKVSHPIFLRHMCPAGSEMPLTGEMTDIGALETALEPMLGAMTPGASFSVQTRIIEGYHPAYKRFDVNTALSGMAEKTGASLDVKMPAQIISVTLSEGMGWMGISSAAENLSDWAGGMRRFKWEQGQISRAEFKLLEALETFGVTLRDGDHAVDLGAAPGGWTRILRRHGLYVMAVDPALLDKRLAKDKRVTHFRETAQVFFRRTEEPCEIMVNDMKMDSAESAELMARGTACLLPGGEAILTLKLPDEVDEWMPRIEQAQMILEEEYNRVGIRQLFHNRSEVTLYLRRKK